MLPTSSPHPLPFDPTRPTMSFMGFKTNVPLGAGEQLARPDVRANGCMIRLDAVPTLLVMLAKGETYGRLALSELPGEFAFVARIIVINSEVVLDLCSESTERDLELLTPYAPTRLPRGLRALSADLLADPLGSVAVHPIPLAVRNAVATAAALVAEAIEKTEIVGMRPHGAVSLRQEGIMMAGYLDMLTRALREPDALPILPVEIARLDQSARSTCTEMWPLLHALDSALTGEPLVAPHGISSPPGEA